MDSKKKKRRLIQLIRTGCDGGNGEFEPLMPEPLKEKARKYDHSYLPFIKAGKVVWVQVF